MTRDEVIAELVSLARQSDDAALANELGAQGHRAEYEELCNALNAVNHDRIMELREYVIEWPRNAKRLRREAVVFRTAADLLARG